MIRQHLRSTMSKTSTCIYRKTSVMANNFTTITHPCKPCSNHAQRSTGTCQRKTNEQPNVRRTNYCTTRVEGVSPTSAVRLLLLLLAMMAKISSGLFTSTCVKPFTITPSSRFSSIASPLPTPPPTFQAPSRTIPRRGDRTSTLRGERRGLLPPAGHRTPRSERRGENGEEIGVSTRPDVPSPSPSRSVFLRGECRSIVFRGEHCSIIFRGEFCSIIFRGEFRLLGDNGRGEFRGIDKPVGRGDFAPPAARGVRRFGEGGGERGVAAPASGARRSNSLSL